MEEFIMLCDDNASFILLRDKPYAIICFSSHKSPFMGLVYVIEEIHYIMKAGMNHKEDDHFGYY